MTLKDFLIKYGKMYLEEGYEEISRHFEPLGSNPHVNSFTWVINDDPFIRIQIRDTFSLYIELTYSKYWYRVKIKYKRIFNNDIWYQEITSETNFEPFERMEFKSEQDLINNLPNVIKKYDLFSKI